MEDLRLLVVGANHRTSALSLRDQLFVDDAAQPAFLTGLGAGQVIAVSTCDRVELWAIDADEELLTAALARQGGMEPETLRPQLYVLTGEAALRHCFAVTASLDSQVIGEPHVLGQVKACQRFAQAAGRCGSELTGILAASYGAAKRVRSETPIAEGPVSIASAAVSLARDLHGELSGAAALLIGAGDMGELVAEHLLAGGVSRLVVTAPRLSRAETLAERLACHAASFDQLADRLVEADIVVAAVGGRQSVLSGEQVTEALRRRRRKPIFLVDTALPGDIEPAVNRIEGAFLYDLSDLERLALESRASRESASARAFALIDEQVGQFLRGRAEREAVPALVLLRRHAEALREQVLKEAGEDAAQATRLLVNRLLHDPSEALKSIAGGEGNWPAAEELLRKLFHLEG